MEKFLKKSNLKERWKNVKDFPYEVSSFGRVRRDGKIRKPWKTGWDRGYLTLDLSFCGKRRMVTVHRLVMETFKPTKRKNMQINHKNCIRTDNRLENLEWVTPSENVKHGVKNGRWHTDKCKQMHANKYGELNYNTKLSKKDIFEIRKSKETNKALGEKYNVSQTHISNIKNKKVWKHI